MEISPKYLKKNPHKIFIPFFLLRTPSRILKQKIVKSGQVIYFSDWIFDQKSEKKSDENSLSAKGPIFSEKYWYYFFIAQKMCCVLS